MAVITDITEQKRRRGRVNVFLDDEFWCGMSRLCQIELGLTPGTEVDETARQKAEQHIAENEAVGYCVDRLADRPRTRHQLTVKLHEREYSEEVITYALDRCEELLLLNDRYYAETLAVSRRDNGQGRRRVAQKLRDDGVERELAEEVLTEAFTPEDEEAQAKTALSQRYSGALTFPEQQRALGFLARRGFSSPAAREAVSELGQVVDDDSDEGACGPTAAEAEALLRRKYPSLNPRDPGDARRAQGFLLRRGCSYDAVREALQALR